MALLSMHDYAGILSIMHHNTVEIVCINETDEEALATAKMICNYMGYGQYTTSFYSNSAFPATKEIVTLNGVTIIVCKMSLCREGSCV